MKQKNSEVQKLNKYLLESGKTLLVDGPATVTVLKGQANILGFVLKPESRVVVQVGRRAPITTDKKALLEIRLGEGGSIDEVEESTIPESWEEAAERIIESEKPVRVIVLGGVDSGKTSLCTYLANRAALQGSKVGIIDADLGQSDIGPPTTIGLGQIREPVSDLTKAEVVDAYLVGYTSPGRALDKVLEGMRVIIERAEKLDVDVLIINTDGWVDGAEAADYKRRLVDIAKPDIILGIEREDELSDVLKTLNGKQVMHIDAPPTIKRRDREKRRLHRELSYRRYLEGAKVQSYPISWVKLQGCLPELGLPATEERVSIVSEALGFTPYHCEENPRHMLIVLGKNQEITDEAIKKLEEALEKDVKVLRKGDERGVLVSLHGDDGRFLGIGVLRDIDFRRRIIRIYTPVEGKVSTICVGCVKLDEEGREVSFLGEETQEASDVKGEE